MVGVFSMIEWFGVLYVSWFDMVNLLLMGLCRNGFVKWVLSCMVMWFWLGSRLMVGFVSDMLIICVIVFW